MPIKGEHGESAAQAITAGVSDLGKKITREAMTVWHAQSQERIMEAAEGRSGLDAQRGSRGDLEGRKNNQLHELAQAFGGIVWNEEAEAWQFACTHAAAVFHEWGARPHEIKAKQAQVLAFEWPDAPEEVKDQFEDSFPTVFFDKVQHPGTPAIGYMRYGREQAKQRLEQAGYEASEFEEPGGEG